MVDSYGDHSIKSLSSSVEIKQRVLLVLIKKMCPIGHWQRQYKYMYILPPFNTFDEYLN